MSFEISNFWHTLCYQEVLFCHTVMTLEIVIFLHSFLHKHGAWFIWDVLYIGKHGELDLARLYVGRSFSLAMNESCITPLHCKFPGVRFVSFWSVEMPQWHSWHNCPDFQKILAPGLSLFSIHSGKSGNM